MTKDQAYQEGRLAALRGKKETDCPYLPSFNMPALAGTDHSNIIWELHGNWLKGHKKGKEEAEGAAKGIGE